MYNHGNIQQMNVSVVSVLLLLY